MRDEYAKKIKDIIARITRAISVIDQVAGELAEYASEELGQPVNKRDVLDAITEIIMYANDTGTSVEDLLLTTCESLVKEQEADNAD